MNSKAATLGVPADEAAALEDALKDYISKIDRSLERGERTQARIEKLKAETRAILARLKAQIR